MTIKSRADNVLSPVLSHATTIEVDHGKGVYLYDTSGKAYLDFTSGIAVASTGHCHPDVVSAIQKQSEKLIHACAGLVYYDANIQLAEKLGKIMGHDLTSVFFTQSGSEAIEAALKLAVYVQKKSKIVIFKGGFHGRTIGALSLTTSKQKYREGYEALLYKTHVVPYPDCYRCGCEGKTCTTCTTDIIEKIKAAGDDVAAVVIEPILGEGGYIPAPVSFLNLLRTYCTENNSLLIMDEIQTGMGRTGQWFCWQATECIPDIVAVAKGVASGMPLGAVVSRPELMAQWDTGAHGGTYSGNPVTCAAGCATIDVISPLLSEIAQKGTQAMRYLQEALGAVPYIGDIRGKGLMIGLEIVKDKTSKAPDPDRAKAIIQTCLDSGLLLIACGSHGHVIRLIPPLIISEKELMKGLECLVSSIHAHS